MIAPSLTSVNARNMHNNFLNTSKNAVSEAKDRRIRAQNFVSGQIIGNAVDFRHFAASSDIVAMRPTAAIMATEYPCGFKEVSANGSYVVFCRE
jgi:hypothetical protein